MYLCYYIIMDNLFSLVLLLVLFFVVPSLLKFLGQYTSASKGDQENTEDEKGLHIPRETLPGHPEAFHPEEDHQKAERTVITSEPIHPKWF